MELGAWDLVIVCYLGFGAWLLSMALENVFSWSKSRDGQFRECQRQYFYDKYLSWGGWDRKAPEKTRLAYVLKNLKNRWAWKGETVHHVIEHTLKSLRRGTVLSETAVLELLTQIMRNDYRSSKAKKYFEDPKNNAGLFEHEYDKPVTDETWKNIHDTAADCVRNFLRSGLYQELLQDNKESWLTIEDLDEFVFDQAKVYVKLDFVRKKNDTVEIYDWKTGKPEAEESWIQMGVYSLYAMQKWGVGLEKIKTNLFYLSEPSPKPVTQTASEELLARTKDFMADSIRQMRTLLLDPLKNIPKPSENFLFTENLKLCQNCNFYRICEKYNP